MKGKRYCIITNRVSQLGGAQLYTLRRAKYLKTKGIDVCIIVCENENFVLAKEFEDISLFIAPLLARPYISINKTLVDEQVFKIKNYIKYTGENNFIVETHTPQHAIWGEVISSVLKAKHISYFLSEFTLTSLTLYPYYDYFKWKVERTELYGISNVSLKLIFGEDYTPTHNNYVNVPFDDKELQAFTHPDFLPRLRSNSITIATVSRLEKAYIPVLIDSVIKIAIKNKNQYYDLIIAGDSSNPAIIRQLKLRYATPPQNLIITFPGYLNPLGRDFFKKLDVFVGMGTACINSIAQKCATITIDLDNRATGILGLTNNNFAYSTNGKFYKLEMLILELAENIELRNQAREAGYQLFQNEFALDICMEKLDGFIDYEKKVEYWNFNEPKKVQPFVFNLINSIYFKSKIHIIKFIYWIFKGHKQKIYKV